MFCWSSLADQSSKMKVLAIILFVGCVAANPIADDDKKPIVIDERFYPKEWEVYKSDHDIVSILVPLNSINFEEDTPDEKESNVVMFFSEADIVDGKRVDKGVYVFQNKVATKVLDNGRDMAASGDDSRLVFIAASDGLYVYKEETKTAEKYGTINDDIIGLAKDKSGDVIYILTANKEVYKVTDDGKAKEKILDKADQIVLDYESNLYYTSDNKVYVLKGNDKKEINIPQGAVTLIKPPYVLDEGVPCVVDDKAYIVYPNGTSEVYGVEFKPNFKPTAYAMEAALLQYHAHDKAIYEYNLVKVIEENIVSLDSVFGDKKSELRSIATSKKTFN
ncbi:uncharacterized protein LOC121738152 [Aricia agestis]|uniref:uncharacterized protein LOC121738152 n=1 Tax=Aricia agestis TaxID=91739 RepID=UPI001C206E4D|nr:uncharacterized protein LOC121738152 [Aricia agestis]